MANEDTGFCGNPASHTPHSWRHESDVMLLCPGIHESPDRTAGLQLEWCGDDNSHARHLWVVGSEEPNRWCLGVLACADRNPHPSPRPLGTMICPGIPAVPAAGATVSDRIAELEAWWVDLAHDEAAKVVPKAIEYGADDLSEIGRELILAGIGTPAVTDDRELREIEAELGIWFYIVGKMARWRSAIRRGERVSDDTLHDIGVYVRMAQRVRLTGRWP